MTTHRTYQDQATLLRMLAHKAVMPSNLQSPKVPLISFFGAEEAVGTSSISLNIAVSLAEQGKRVVLIDFDLEKNGIEQITGRRARCLVSRLIISQSNLHEYLVPGPGGILMLATQVDNQQLDGLPESLVQSFLYQIDQLGKHADLVLIDTGSQINPQVKWLWQRSEEFTLLTTVSSDSITAGYTKIKQLQSTYIRKQIGTIFTRCSQAAEYKSVSLALMKSCQEFLNLPAYTLGSVDFSLQLAAANSAGESFVTRYPESLVSQQTHKLAAEIIERLPVQSGIEMRKAA